MIIIIILGILSLITLFSLIINGKLRNKRKQESIEFIRNYEFPEDTVIVYFKKNYPQLNSKELDLVISGLKQFFIAKLLTKEKILMPSKIADDLWNCHLQDFPAYINFCKKAFGKPLTHFPVILEKEKPLLERFKRNQQKLLNTYIACKHAQQLIDSSQVVPPLFLLDLILNVENGFYYTPEIISYIDSQIQIKNYNS